MTAALPLPLSSQQPSVRAQVLDLSRQDRLGPLTAWLSNQLDAQIAAGQILPPSRLQEVSDRLASDLLGYRLRHGVNVAVLGMSGGLDSALTAALFKRAGWTVVGVTLPIHQDPSETQRGVEAINALGLDAHVHLDLSDTYDAVLPTLGDAALVVDPTKAAKIRRGNVRARLRMIALYNQAAARGGLVASTDNLSELAAGFWTLHGDVGDLSPIQALTKSWEVPFLARLNGVPEATVRATPTDGLGIDAGDEAQLGCSYLEWDLINQAVVNELARPGAPKAGDPSDRLERLAQDLGVDAATRPKFDAVLRRMAATGFKRHNPAALAHPTQDRYGQLEAVDRWLGA